MIDIAALRLATSQIAIDGAAYSSPSIDVKSIDSPAQNAGAASATGYHATAKATRMRRWLIRATLPAKQKRPAGRFLFCHHEV